jgi:hypothetical protein
MTRRGPWRGVQFTVHDLGDQVVWQRDEILGGRRAIEWGNPRHGSDCTSSCTTYTPGRRLKADG